MITKVYLLGLTRILLLANLLVCTPSFHIQESRWFAGGSPWPLQWGNNKDHRYGCSCLSLPMEWSQTGHLVYDRVGCNETSRTECWMGTVENVEQVWLNMSYSALKCLCCGSGSRKEFLVSIAFAQSSGASVSSAPGAGGLSFIWNL